MQSRKYAWSATCGGGARVSARAGRAARRARAAGGRRRRAHPLLLQLLQRLARAQRLLLQVSPQVALGLELDAQPRELDRAAVGVAREQLDAELLPRRQPGGHDDRVVRAVGRRDAHELAADDAGGHRHREPRRDGADHEALGRW